MATTDAPVAPSARFDSLDHLRGLAVLMIFSVNIRHMVQPFWTQGDPTVWMGSSDLAIDKALQFAVDGKWVAIFAMLFGAGLMLLHDKAAAAGTEPNKRIVRRQLWLVAFGFVHMAFIWLGDILLTYGVIGLVVMPLLGRSSRTVALWAAITFAIGLFLVWGSGALMSLMPAEDLAASGFSVPDLIAAEIDAKAGGVLDQIAWRSEAAALIIGNIIAAGPMILSFMLLGVLLFRSGFMTARWPVPRYLIVAAACLVLAWTIDAWRIAAMGIWDGRDPSVDHMILTAQYAWVGMLDGPLGGVGYAALVNAAIAAGLRFAPLAAAGRMAFTNYIACSLIGTTLAAGHGANLLGDLTLAQSLMIVAATWLAILIVSPLWLSTFRYGPLEWLWRSLSYGTLQPMRKQPTLATA